MTLKIISEVLYLTSKIEKLLDSKGAKVEGLTAKVRFFDNFEKVENSEEYNKIGHKFYFKDGNYFIKEEYEFDLDIEESLEAYEEYKNQNYYYRIYKRDLLGGHFNNLVRIAHERNQLFHIHDYTINNYPDFFKAALETIHYLENSQKSLFLCKVDLLKERETTPLIFTEQTQLRFFDQCSLAFFENIFYTLGFLFLKLLFWPLKQIMNNIFPVIIIVLLYFGYHYITKKPISPVDTCHYYQVTSKALNIRQKPSNKAEILAKVYKDDIICVTDKKARWLYIKERGWIYGKFTKEQNP